jgi:hypothetical protein
LAVSDNKLKLEVKSVLFLAGQFFGSDIAVNDYLLSWDLHNIGDYREIGALARFNKDSGIKTV